MSQQCAAEAGASRDVVTAHISGSVSGQVAVGNCNLQIGAIHGGVVTLSVPGEQPVPRPRSTPVILRPRRGCLIGREAEVDRTTAALRAEAVVQVHGPVGVGKTVLLNHLAHQLGPADFADGVVYFRARNHPVSDLLQFLFDAFYDCDVPFKPTDGELCHYLQPLKAFVVLDDVDLAREDVQEVLNTAPGCVFLLSSEECCVWGDGRALALRGLPEAVAVELVERELGRDLLPEERTATSALCTAVDGHPLRLLQSASLVRDGERSLQAVVDEARSTPSEIASDRVMALLSEPKRRVLGVLAVLGGAGLHADHLARVADISDTAPLLRSLVGYGLVQGEDGRYSMTVRISPETAQSLECATWGRRLARYFTGLGERADDDGRHARDLSEESAALLAILAWAERQSLWLEVLRLGRAIEPSLAWARRWGAWEQVLQRTRDSAEALGDHSALAWSLHQLGTRALCLEKADQARQLLTRALELRESIGDRDGASVTRQNLEALTGPPLPPPRERPPDETATGRPRRRPKHLRAYTSLVILGLLALLLRRPSAPQLIADPARLQFETVNASKTVRITNGGKTQVGVERVVIADDPAGQFSMGADECSGITLEPGTSCGVTVTLAALSTDDVAATADLRVIPRDGATTRTVALTGLPAASPPGEEPPGPVDPAPPSPDPQRPVPAATTRPSDTTTTNGSTTTTATTTPTTTTTTTPSTTTTSTTTSIPTTVTTESPPSTEECVSCSECKPCPFDQKYGPLQSYSSKPAQE